LLTLLQILHWRHYGKKTAHILQKIKEFIWSEELKNQGRMDAKDFTRKCILSFPILVLFFISLAKKSLQVSLNGFLKLICFSSISKQAFSKARKKLNPYTFILLNKKLIEEYYTDNHFPTWKGLRVIAIDGSDVQLPQTEQIKDIFGTAKNQNGATLGMAQISQAYDVFSGLTLDIQVEHCNASERDLFVKHVEVISHFSHGKVEDLYILDRGYPSLALFFYAQLMQKHFLMRCSIASCFAKIKKIVNSGKRDVIVRLYAKDAGKEQVVELKKRVPKLDRKTAYIDVRCIVVTLETGENELLITSLIDQSKYIYEAFKELYFKRWGIEENYKWHKQVLELENFSGHSALAVEQDIFSLVFTANITTLIMREAQQELIEEHQEKEYKHEYKINKRLAISAVRGELITVLVNRNADIGSFCQCLKTEIKKYLCPIRPNRKYQRSKKGRLKFGLTTRPCI
jgi:hypothetical protein